MAEDSTEQQGIIRTNKDLRESQFGKTEVRYKKEYLETGFGYTAEYTAKEGGEIGAIRSFGRAAILQGYRFDINGELSAVVVEKRILPKIPESSNELGHLYDSEMQEVKETEQDLMGVGMPAYRIVLEREADGKFAITDKVTSGRIKEWEQEHSRVVNGRSS